MAVLTPEQVARILEIIRDGSTAIAIATTGSEFPKAELDRLVSEGYLKADELEDFVKDSFAFGQLMQQTPAAKAMSYADFQKHVKAHPVVMSKPEKQAYDVARQRAGMYCVGLGSRYSEIAGQAIIEHDDALATRLRSGIKAEVSEAVAKRDTVGQLKTRLGQMAGEWERDWGRVAATESQMAHQEGFLGSVVERHGDDELLAKVPEPDACPHCLKHYRDAEGKPRVAPASWWYEQGTSNAGRKAADWKPVLGAMHPWCRCQLVRVPGGWEFDDEWSLVPSDTEKSDQVAESATRLTKARKLQGRTKFQGFDISIENRKGSVRRWYDKATDTEGETKMRIPYGYIRMTEGTDGDHVDVFVGAHEDAPNVYVVHQMKAPSFKVFDEDKCMLGFRSAASAKRAYLAHFDQPGFFGSMTTMTVDAFRDKVFSRKGVMIKAGPFIGPRGGKWADPKHTIPWKEPKPTKQLGLFDQPPKRKFFVGDMETIGRSNAQFALDTGDVLSDQEWEERLDTYRDNAGTTARSEGGEDAVDVAVAAFDAWLERARPPKKDIPPQKVDLDEMMAEFEARRAKRKVERKRIKKEGSAGTKDIAKMSNAQVEAIALEVIERAYKQHHERKAMGPGAKEPVLTPAAVLDWAVQVTGTVGDDYAAKLDGGKWPRSRRDGVKLMKQALERLRNAGKLGSSGVVINGRDARAYEPTGFSKSEVAAWTKAITAVGFTPDQFSLVVKHARQGHDQARKALDSVYAELAKAGFPIEHASRRPGAVGTMGHHSKPARTAGENVRPGKVGEPHPEWPLGREDMKKKGRRQKRKLPLAKDKLDVVGHSRGKGGWGHGYDADAVANTTRSSSEPQDRTDARESLDVQQRSRASLREGSKISDLEIHR